MPPFTSITPVSRFSPLTVFLHWASVLLLLTAFALASMHLWWEDSPWDSRVLDTHRQIGLLVLLLTLCRWGLRWRSRSSEVGYGSSPLLNFLAALSHWLMYGLLFSLPLLGWAMTNAQGHLLEVGGLVRLPVWVPVDPDWADTLQEWHAWAAWGLLSIVCVHVIAALWHHFVWRDDVLTAMLPRFIKSDVQTFKN